MERTIYGSWVRISKSAAYKAIESGLTIRVSSSKADPTIVGTYEDLSRRGYDWRVLNSDGLKNYMHCVARYRLLHRSTGTVYYWYSHDRFVEDDFGKAAQYYNSLPADVREKVAGDLNRIGNRGWEAWKKHGRRMDSPAVRIVRYMMEHYHDAFAECYSGKQYPAKNATYNDVTWQYPID